MSAPNVENRAIQPRGGYSEVLARLKLDEGFRQFLYRCTANKLTIGYGFNLEDCGIPEVVAAFWLEYEVKEVERELAKNFPTYRVLDKVRQDVLLNMAYNLGVPKLMEFRNMLSAICENDYATAAKHMLDSKWAKQVGMRAQRLARAMETGREA
jgi:Phage-related lysozyme (muraminidase)